MGITALRRAAAISCVGAWIGAFSLAGQGQTRSIADRVYSDTQASRGQQLYQKECVACHGAAKDGFRDARLVRFARALARSGALVLTPDLEGLRRFRVTEESVGQIVEAQRALRSRTDLVEGGRVSLIGISFAGTLSLLAAADPVIRDSVPAVLSFGGYADLEGLVRHWLEAAPEAPPGEYPVECYGRVIAILNNLDPLVPEVERDPLREGLERFLREKRPPPRPPDLGGMASDLWDAATTLGPTRPDLVERIVLAAGPGARPRTYRRGAMR